MGKISVKNKILCEVFDCELDDLQSTIVNNADCAVVHIKAAMEILAMRRSWDVWKRFAVRHYDADHKEPHIDEPAERKRFLKWFEDNEKKQENN